MKVINIALLCIIAIGAIVALAPSIADNVRYRDFVINGTIVDEAGNPLDDVGVSVVTGKSIKSGFESKTESKFDKVNGSFGYRLDNYSNVSLLFFKEGYQEEQLQWHVGGEYSGIQVVMKKGSGPASRPAPALPRARLPYAKSGTDSQFGAR